MTSQFTVDTEETDQTQSAWQELARLKVNSKNCWKIVNYSTVERITSTCKENKMKLDGYYDNIANNINAENFQSIATSKANQFACDSHEEKLVSTKTTTSTHLAPKSVVKTRTNKGLRVQFHEHVQLLTDENRPTIQRLKSCSLANARERDHLPKITRKSFTLCQNKTRQIYLNCE